MNAEHERPWSDEYRAAIRDGARGCYGEAARRLSDLVAAHPAEPPLHRELGNALLQLGAYEESIRHFKEAIFLQSDSWAPWSGLGQAYAEMSQWDLAEEAFRNTLALRENSNQCVFLAGVLEAKGDLSGALHYCHRAIEIRPASADASLKAEDYLNLGLISFRLGLYGKAARAFETVIALDPREPHALGELGYLTLRNGRLKAAEQLLRRAVKRAEELAQDDPSLKPVLARNRTCLALTIERQGRLREARRHFRLALGLAEGDRWIVAQYQQFRRRVRNGRGF